MSQVERRDFLKYMSASLALAGISSCTRMPPEKIIPYVVQPENIIPGESLVFASSSLFGGYAKGILVESHDGRPTKIEGNPLHPASLGATDIFTQAEILTLYDPHRAQTVLHLEEPSTWDAFLRELPHIREGFRILTERVTSPSLAAQIQRVLARYPGTRWHAYEPLHTDSLSQGSVLAFGKDLRPIYHFDRARVILSLDGDFLGPGSAQQAYARDFMNSRRISEQVPPFNRLYSVESSVSLTGANADHRLAVKPSQVEGIALAIGRELGLDLPSPPAWTKNHLNWITQVSADLLQNPSIVLAGEQQTPTTHLLVHAINQKLGSKIEQIEPVDLNPSPYSESLSALIEDIHQDKVKTLLILGGDPVYATPGNLGLGRALSRVGLRIYAGLYRNSTSAKCHWHLPLTHFLEAWGDAKSFDGTVSFQQPLITPLYDGKSPLEILALFEGDPGLTSRQALRNHWLPLLGEEHFEASVRDGLLAHSQAPTISASLHPGWKSRLAPIRDSERFEISFRPDPTIWDGRYAENGWLQELPKPLLHLTWDNAVLFSPSDAGRLGVENEDLVSLSLEGLSGGQTLDAPVLIVPGHPQGTVTALLGYGRGHGFDAYLLMASPTEFFYAAKVEKLSGKRSLATTHGHFRMEGREPILHGTFQEYLKRPEKIVAAEIKAPVATLLKSFPSAQESWAMVIDLNTCIGCGTCTIACQAENNIPIVGKDQVRREREMHWIRVDRYYHGPLDSPQTFFQPVPCMHCETAPCEEVCPTAATNHSSDGINQMVYNRCVGTRYCSNNCPYKVRRFNFFGYAKTKSKTLNLMHNPDVTVRTRGVMEKCTYCIQRIQRARITAEKEDRKIRDGEIVTACAEACPTQAIVFGDLNDPRSRVGRLRKLPLEYPLLGDLGTRPRTTYLAKLTHPNPALREDRK